MDDVDGDSVTSLRQALVLLAADDVLKIVR